LDNLAQYTLADVTKNQSKLADKLKIIKRRS